MVGEIRDLETAEIAVKAAQTGHMVLSTLHTNDAPQTIARLMNMGIAPYNITSSVSLVIAQRLAGACTTASAPRTCPNTRCWPKASPRTRSHAGITVFEAVGCEDCTEGYKGRAGIYQVMPMNDEIQQIVLAGGNVQQITEASLRSGVRDLRRSALDKVKQGITSLIEINRVTKD
jgi:type IV pilus assembly protein PilB